MQLLQCKTLWGHIGSVSEAADLAVTAGFSALEAPLPATAADIHQLAEALEQNQLGWVQEICTAGSYVPRRRATIGEHLNDLRDQLTRGREIGARFSNVMGGCDAWSIDDSVRFFSEAMDIAISVGVDCSFETHRGRSMYCPWNSMAILKRLPEMKITCDFSHWVVVSERLMDCEWDAIECAANQAHHIHSRVGYDQGPQVPHPGAPEYREALVSHQRCWEAIWDSQQRRGYTETTMTPEFGPDGYLHTLPFTGAPVADLWDVNRWIANQENKHFENYQRLRNNLETLEAPGPSL